MQSVFGYHDRNGFKIYLYATSASDGSPCRGRIEAESDQFLDVSSWSDGDVVQRIVSDGIHICEPCLNLNCFVLIVVILSGKPGRLHQGRKK